MPEVKQYEYKWKAKRSGWTYKLTAMLPGAILTENDWITVVKLPRGFINGKKLEAAYGNLPIGLPSKAPELSFVINLLKSNENSKELCKALQKKHYITSLVGSIIDSSNPANNKYSCGVIWTLTCDYAGANELGAPIEVFKGVTRADCKVNYEYSKKTLEVKAVDLNKVVLESVSSRIVGERAAWDLTTNYGLTNYNAIQFYVDVNIDKPFVLSVKNPLYLIPLSLVIDSATNVINEEARKITREANLSLFIEFPFLKYYKQSGAADSRGSSLQTSELYAVLKTNVNFGLRMFQETANMWEFLEKLYEYSMAKAILKTGGVYASHVYNGGTTPYKPNLNFIAGAKWDSEDGGISTATLNSIEEVSDDLFSDVSEWSNNNGRSGGSFSAKLLISNYSPCVKLEIKNTDAETEPLRAYYSATTNRYHELDLYYLAPSVLKPAKLAAYKVHETPDFTINQNSYSQNTGIYPKVFNWQNASLPLYPGDSYIKRTSEAIFDCQKNYGAAEAYPRIIMALFGALEKNSIELHYEKSASYISGGGGGFAPISFEQNFDLTDLNDDYGAACFYNNHTILGYEIDFEKESAKIDFVRRYE